MIFYGVLQIMVIVGGLLLLSRLPWPRPGQVTMAPPLALHDPYDLAYLRAGPHGVLQQAFLNLVAQGVLVGNWQRIYWRKKYFFNFARPGAAGPDDPEMQALAQWFRGRPSVSLRFDSPFVLPDPPAFNKPRPTVLGRLLTERRRRLQEQGLATPGWYRPVAIALGLVAWLFISGLSVGVFYLSTSSVWINDYVGPRYYDEPEWLWMLYSLTPFALCFFAALPFLKQWFKKRATFCTGAGAAALQQARAQLTSPCGEWALDGRRVAAFGCDALEGTVIDSLDTSLVRLLTWMGTNRLRWPWGRRQRDDA